MCSLLIYIYKRKENTYILMYVLTYICVYMYMYFVLELK